MRHTWFAVLLLALAFGCSEDRDSPSSPAVPIALRLEAGSRWVEDVEVRLESRSEGHMIWTGQMPFEVTVDVGDSLTAHFQVNVSNFGLNYPECNCTISGYSNHDCHEPHIVAAADSIWLVAFN